ncbi:MAG: hypothetical protein V9G13_07825 [Marmoricola sp.]
MNFFGIKSKGRRVAFLIDAERYMLTDPRGGYPAYEIVKNEIAGMIGKLGLDTFFNVILYEAGTSLPLAKSCCQRRRPIKQRFRIGCIR